MIITKADVMSNSHIDDGLLTDSEYNDIIETAETHVMNLLRQSIDALIDKHGCVPSPVKRACLLVADDLYHIRGDREKVQRYSNGYISMMLKPYVQLIHT